MQEMRLNKYLSEMGVCSRREADRLVEEGKILVDGKPALMGQKVTEGQGLLLQKAGGAKDPPILLAVNKPRGIVCTTSEKDRAENIVEFLNYPCRIYPVGRLNKRFRRAAADAPIKGIWSTKSCGETIMKKNMRLWWINRLRENF